MGLPLSIFTNLFLILKAIVQVKPDVVVVSSGHTFVGLLKLVYRGLLVCRYASLPRTLSKSFLARLLRPFEMFTIRKSLSFINSQLMADSVRSSLGIKIPVINPGVNYQTFSSVNELDDGRTLLYFSQIRPNKNQMFLVDLMPSILEKHDARLILAGEVEQKHTSYLERLLKRVEELGLTGKVSVVTEVERQGIRSLYSKATVYLHPAGGEPFGMTVIEAMACGKPVIVHRGVGAREAIVDGESGFTVGGDPEEWVRCIELLLTDKKLCETVSENARLRAKAFSWDVVAERFELLVKDSYTTRISSEGNL